VEPRPIPGNHSSTPPLHFKVHQGPPLNPAPKLHLAEPAALCHPDSQIIQVPSPEPSVTTDEAQASGKLPRKNDGTTGRPTKHVKTETVSDWTKKTKPNSSYSGEITVSGSSALWGHRCRLCAPWDSACDGHQDAIPEDQTLIH
jgi:hypothetical protein